MRLYINDFPVPTSQDDPRSEFKTIAFEIPANSTVAELKASINERFRIPTTMFYLTFNGKILLDDKTVEHYKITDNSFLRCGLKQ
jgi:hypothetical protein